MTTIDGIESGWHGGACGASRLSCSAAHDAKTRARRRAARDRADRDGSRSPPLRRRAARWHAARSRPWPARTARPSMPGSATSKSRCGNAGIRLLDRWRSSRARDGARWRLARRPVRRCRCGPAVAGLARDAGHRRVPPASHEVRCRADPRRRLRLHDPDAPPPPADRRSWAAPTRPAGRSSTGPASTSSSASV